MSISVRTLISPTVNPRFYRVALPKQDSRHGPERNTIPNPVFPTLPNFRILSKVISQFLPRPIWSPPRFRQRSVDCNRVLSGQEGAGHLSQAKKNHLAPSFLPSCMPAMAQFEICIQALWTIQAPPLSSGCQLSNQAVTDAPNITFVFCTSLVPCPRPGKLDGLLIAKKTQSDRPI